jgi:hypothetical protein
LDVRGGSEAKLGLVTILLAIAAEGVSCRDSSNAPTHERFSGCRLILKNGIPQVTGLQVQVQNAKFPEAMQLAGGH